MKNIFRIFKISKPLYSLIATIAVLILITSLVELITPVISKFIVDEIVNQVQAGKGELDRLYFFIILGFILNIIGIGLSATTNRLGDHFGGKIRKFLTEKFYDKVLTLPQSYFDSQISGKIVNQLNRGIVSIQGFINSWTNFILPTFLQSIFVIVLLSYYNIFIGLLVFSLFPVYLSISYYSSKRWGKHETKKNEIEDVTRGRLQEVISNIRLVKSFTNEKNEYNIISSNLSEVNKIYAKQSSEFHRLDFIRNVSLHIILLGINLLLFYNTYQGELTIGELVLIIQLVAQARIPLFAMSFILEGVQQAEAGSKEFFEILDLESKENYTDAKPSEKLKNPTIKFSDVEFEYSSDQKILDKISFELSKNETIALVGPSGAGKSTIVNLILKLYESTGGEIFLNDKSYKNLSTNFIRSNIALVFQDNELFSSTIKENVVYGSNANDDEIIQALKKANAWSFVEKFPNGINTEIGERGIKLSGGQKQRVQIARAILKDAPILILDEATSSLDAKSESEVQNAVDNLLEDRLVIIIAHRFSTIQNASKIIVLNDKKVEAVGTPQELANKPGIYSDLLKYQVEGNKKLLKNFELR